MNETKIEKTPYKEKPYLLLAVVAVLSAVYSIILVEGIRVFNVSPYEARYMNLTEGILMLFGTILLFGLLYYLCFRYWKVRVNWPILVSLALVAIGNAVALFLFPDSVTSLRGESFLLTASDRIRISLLFGASLFYVYFVSAIVPQIQRGFRMWHFLLKGIVIVSLIAVLYSLVMEFAKYQEFFTNLLHGSYSSTTDIESYMFQKNVFAVLLSLAIFSELYIHFDRGGSWRLVLALALYIEIFVIRSKTTLITTGMVLLAYAILLFALQIKKGKKMLGVIGITLICFALAFLVLCAVISIPGLRFIHDGIVEMFNDFKAQDGSAFTSRGTIWQQVIDFSKTDVTRLIFGAGETNFQRLIIRWYPTEIPNGFAHNGFLELLGRGGILRVAIYVFLLGYWAVIFLKTWRKNKKPVYWFYLVMAISGLLHSMLESEYLFAGDWKSILFGVFMFLPVFGDYYQPNETEKIEEKHSLKETAVASLRFLPSVLFIVSFAFLGAGVTLNQFWAFGVGVLLQAFYVMVVALTEQKEMPIFFAIGEVIVLDIIDIALVRTTTLYFAVDPLWIASLMVLLLGPVYFLLEIHLVYSGSSPCANRQIRILEESYVTCISPTDVPQHESERSSRP